MRKIFLKSSYTVSTGRGGQFVPDFALKSEVEMDFDNKIEDENPDCFFVEFKLKSPNMDNFGAIQEPSGNKKNQPF